MIPGAMIPAANHSITDYSEVDVLGQWYIPVNCWAEKERRAASPPRRS